MSEFDGSGNRVRCVDCVFLSGKICTSKEVGVSPRKRRSCSVYKFTGVYKNRTTPESTYVPYVSKSTMRVMRKLFELGILGSSMPASTATAGVLQVNDVEQQVMAGGDLNTTAEPPTNP